MSHRAALNLIDRCLAVAAWDVNLKECREGFLSEQPDWLKVIALANQHLVAPALWTGFNRASLFHELPEDVRDYLALLHRRNAHRNERIRRQCLGLGTILEAAGVRAVLLKGSAWLFDGSEAPASDRMMRDIDLLVAPALFDVAVHALIAAGYKDTSDSIVEVDHFHYAPLLPEQGEVSVEIHRDLAHRANLLPSPKVIDSAVRVAPGLLLPGRSQRVVHNVIHAQIENGDFVGGIVNLRDTLDLARLMHSRDEQVDWAHLADEASNRGFFRQLAGAIQVSHCVLNSPLPPCFANFPSRLHAARCLYQRKWPSIEYGAAKLGILSRALAWDRDAYGLNVQRGSLKSHLLVNKLRVHRAWNALGRVRARTKQ